MNPPNSPNDSRVNRRFTTVEEAFEALLMAAEELENRDLSLGLQNQDVEMEERKGTDSNDEATLDDLEVRRWAEERKRRMDYYVARNYALDLHSNFNPKIVGRKEEEEVKRDEEKTEFQKAKEVIKKRREKICTTSDMVMIDLVMQRKAPTLMELSVRALAQNYEAIKSLKLVPDHLRKKLSNLVNGVGKVDTRFMQLLIEGSPCEVCAKICVDIDEDDMIKILCDCDTASLKVLILGLCGRAMTDYMINEFLKRSPRGFPSLTTLSLQGAFCLTDNALALISNSSPLLRFINLSDCSLLTFRAVEILADKFGSTLKGLSIGGCLGITRSDVFSNNLYKFVKLKYLSVAGLYSVNDRVVETFFIVHSSFLTDLSLASCREVTDDCIWHMRYCNKLEALDISDLENLTDKSLEYITEGCKSLKSVILTRNRFSDEGIAAFLEVLGGSLNQLCLNKVQDVGPDTAFSLAKVCKRLQYLDLSWCRRLTEEDLRRILSCCWSLRSLKLFGWTQVEDTFLEELSRSHIHITGLKMTSLYAHLDDSYPSVGANFFS